MYIALWDNDKEGRQARKRAEVAFGPKEAQRFDVLPSKPGSKNRKMQGMIDSTDLEAIKSKLGLPDNSSYESTMVELYYAKDTKKTEVRKNFSADTKFNFETLRKIID
ncbi:unnamed protein product, partial [marine sediment metagenome]